MIEEIQQLMFDEFGLDDLGIDTPIFSSKTLDSMDVLRLIVALEKKYEVEIPPFAVTIEMFDTIVSISDLLAKKLG